MPDLSIIIVNWNSANFLRSCLASIRTHTHNIECEVIVVDNASFDGSAELISSEFPTVKFIQSTENLGFARANNLGVTHSAGRNLLFLNPDTEVLDSSLEHLSASLDALKDGGIIGARLLNTDFTIQSSCIQRFPTALNQFLDNDFLRRAFPTASIWGTRPLYIHSATPCPVEVVSGACLMIKREVFELVNGFSTEYFMYAEDTDLCSKVNKAGWKSYYLDDARVVHHGGGSSGSAPQSNFSAVLMRQSLLTFLRLRRGPLSALMYRIAMAANSLLRVTALTAGIVLTNSEQRRLLRLTLRKWTSILRWSLGLEGWAKNLR